MVAISSNYKQIPEANSFRFKVLDLLLYNMSKR